MKIIDNISHLLGDDLRETIKPGSRLKIAASCFSIYAFEALKRELEQIDSLEFIFTSPAFLPAEVTDNLRKEHREGEAFKISKSSTVTHKASVHSAVKYDLIGKIAEATTLTRGTIAAILSGMNIAVFSQYKSNPEDFIHKASRLINEQKATVIVEHLSYDPVGDAFSSDIFTQEKNKEDFSKAVKTDRHIFDYVFTDSKNEKAFVQELDASNEVVVYAKLPRGFSIPTPVGDYNPDWAIAFKDGAVKHVYFVAETKGSLSSLDLRKTEESKIECARKFFAKITSDQVRYDVVDSYGKLMEIVQ